MTYVVFTVHTMESWIALQKRFHGSTAEYAEHFIYWHVLTLYVEMDEGEGTSLSIYIRASCSVDVYSCLMDGKCISECLFAMYSKQLSILKQPVSYVQIPPRIHRDHGSSGIISLKTGVRLQHCNYITS